ncbi:hypothetical protein JQ634_19545 [Bradyrhizobium sp. AUGA SZCCT0240]|uniref:hypothetical protein n=1 Tax=unclassified Bradyrhizobium TaxID=2631580 RepID=UPI001BA6962D|nr:MULTISPECIES: hypothetical protein [unclassified Bradyrhizobium]MBR1200313.1 hypothetical protein [Bradyrhizobium sp. AUGA SZCCT0158]MBR1241053.1 hypothetical protein [Bradyrhizobium sp. AUGA SZCCT0274]MBR1255889.1 hypothetical protein [Bradyrhizobium sp. AUGA SZCCT0240]
MINGRRNAVVGLTTIFTFVIVELAVVVCAVGLVLELVFDVDVPLLAFNDE